jgi:hypothetical protein
MFEHGRCVVKAGSDALAVAMREIMVPGQLESLVGDLSTSVQWLKLARSTSLITC